MRVNPRGGEWLRRLCAWMKISPDTKDTILFAGGCLGMAIFGLLMPLLGEGFDKTLFGAWTGVAMSGVLLSINSRKGPG